MTNKEKEILDAIEYSMFMYPGIEGVLDEYKHDSIKGYVCPAVDYEEYNRVGMSRLTEEQTEEAIKEVLSHYKSLGLTSVGWLLSPQSQPSNLEKRLVDSGFKKEIPILGMVRSTAEKLEINMTDEFEIKKYEEEEAIKLLKNPEIQYVYEKAYGTPEGASQIMNYVGDMFRDINYTIYVAHDKKTDKPVAFGAISYVPNTNCAVLNGAATLPEYRKRGIYSTLLQLRYDQAKNDGIEHLLIQAKEETSAPIAAKNGFEKVCEIPMYVWRAEKTEQ